MGDSIKRKQSQKTICAIFMSCVLASALVPGSALASTSSEQLEETEVVQGEVAPKAGETNIAENVSDDEDSTSENAGVNGKSDGADSQKSAIAAQGFDAGHSDTVQEGNGIAVASNSDEPLSAQSNTPNNAIPAYFQKYSKGVVNGYANDEDWYSIYLPSRGSYSISLTNTMWQDSSNSAAGCEVYDSYHDYISSSGVSTKFNSTSPRYTTFYVSAPGTIYVKVSGASYSKLDCPYRFVVYKQGLATIDGKHYFFNANGTFGSGWRRIDNKSYYFNKSTGIAETGLKRIGGKLYCFSSTGYLQSGWKRVGGKSYYFSKSTGVAAKGLTVINNKRYYFGPSNYLQSGWKTLGGNTYFFYQKTGAAATGLVTIGSNKYCFSAVGVMQKSCWKQLYPGKVYYFDSSGVMQRNTWIGRYHVNADGVRDKAR